MEKIDTQTPDKDRDIESIVLYPAYYVESISKNERLDDTVLVAVDVKIRENYIEWFDTEKHRKFIHSNTLTNQNGAIEFVNKKTTGIYRLIPLTLDVYSEKVRDKMYGSNLDFDSEEELWEALLSSTGDL